MSTEAAKENGLSRREFLKRAAIAGAAAAGAGVAVRGLLSKGTKVDKVPVEPWWAEDSIFKPRADHAARILGGK